ncbi:MAG TPA: DEAD/DEAH box helicase, partial [Chloroflexota bacterium]
LVLVHRQHLLDQWRERLGAFLDLPAVQIGQVGAGRHQPTGQVDVALIQSLGRKGAVDDLVAHYGQVIVDECHHIPAFSFERVLREAKARYVLGLSATPVRKDGHHPIVVMQCGPIRHRVDALAQAAARPFEHVLIPRTTVFNVPPEAEAAGIQRLYARLATDPARNDLIVADVLRAVSSGRSPLVLTARTDHLDLLAARLGSAAPHLVVLRGGMGAKQRRSTLARLAEIPPSEPRVLLATGRYVGEGFDDARLDTLFLAMPVSWRGTIQQYAGRLHRLHATKQVVQVYDYVDANVPVLARMYERRLKGYKAIGYAVQPPTGT